MKIDPIPDHPNSHQSTAVDWLIATIASRRRRVLDRNPAFWRRLRERCKRRKRLWTFPRLFCRPDSGRGDIVWKDDKRQSWSPSRPPSRANLRWRNDLLVGRRQGRREKSLRKTLKTVSERQDRIVGSTLMNDHLERTSHARRISM